MEGPPEPYTVPFPKQPDANAPEPLLEFHGYFVMDGKPIHLVGERWKAEEAVCDRAFACPDPMQPGIILAARLENGVDGSLIRAVSFQEFEAIVAVIREGSGHHSAETLRFP